MNRRLLAIAAALVFALIGGGIVIGVTRSADERAVAQLDPVEVLVVGEQPIPEGTAASEVGAYVERTTIPGTAAIPDRLTDLTEVDGMVTATALQPGEQLLTSRFVAPESLDDAPEAIVPEDKHEITIPLEGHRALGGRITPGETVGVTLSFDKPEERSHLHLHKILVTSVQGAPTPPAARASEAETEAAAESDAGSTTDASDAPAADPVPENSLLISLALDTKDVEEVIFAAEFGTIWLTREGEDVPDDPTSVIKHPDLWPASEDSE